MNMPINLNKFDTKKLSQSNRHITFIIQIIIVHNEIYAPSIKKLLIVALTGDSTPSDRHGEDLFKKVSAKLTLISDFKVKLFFITLCGICYQI